LNLIVKAEANCFERGGTTRMPTSTQFIEIHWLQLAASFIEVAFNFAHLFTNAFKTEPIPAGVASLQKPPSLSLQIRLHELVIQVSLVLLFS
jgi:hypothetical protein